jgi:hypothetical protein
VYDLVPDTFRICRESICRYSSVVLWEENGELRLVEKTALLWVVVTFLEPLAQFCDRLLKFLWL